MESLLTVAPSHHHSSNEFDEHGRHGHQASLADGLDFVNSLEYSKGLPHDELTSATVAVQWFQQHSLLHSDMAAALNAEVAGDQAAAERLLQRVQKTRSALRELLDAAVEKRPPSDSALREVNRALRAPYVYELVPAADGVSLDHRHDGDPINGALSRLSEAVARELTQDDKERLRVCANDECRWVFRDNSPAGRRKWCDMSSCGNRAKAARHRERQKQKAESPPEAQLPLG
ncbi:MAG TPA: CGNR zinc finger domain-containing protein [Candidatus Limnocylindrales bacterium]|jgi:predicted RNA-binding Zn ribbon-like protein